MRNGKPVKAHTRGGGKGGSGVGKARNMASVGMGASSRKSDYKEMMGKKWERQDRKKSLGSPTSRPVGRKTSFLGRIGIKLRKLRDGIASRMNFRKGVSTPKAAPNKGKKAERTRLKNTFAAKANKYGGHGPSARGDMRQKKRNPFKGEGWSYRNAH